MAKATDDLEAVRIVTAALEEFSPDDQERIIRWAREKLGLTATPRSHSDIRTSQGAKPALAGQSPDAPSVNEPAVPKDLKTFTTTKSPKSDVQFAATVAYFYRFEASPDQRRIEIDRVVLQDACRLAGRARLKDPLKTLNNAKSLGLLDSGAEPGRFVINTVGENLVAMTLPGLSDSSGKGRNSKKQTKPPKRKKK